MAVQEVTFKFDGNQVSYDYYPNDHSHFGDTVRFTAHSSSGGVGIRNLPPEVFEDASDFQLEAGESEDRIVRTDAPKGKYSYQFNCLGSPIGWTNDGGHVNFS